MIITTVPTGDQLMSGQAVDKAVVVLDVLRSTSTIVTALANGALEVIPAPNKDQCLALVASWAEKPHILGGEYLGEHLNGFQLGNSPREYTPSVVAGKSILFTSTNGAKAIANAASAPFLILGAFLNAEAVTRMLLDQDRPILLLCSGTRGKFSLEDSLAAGMIIHNLLQYRSYHLDDLSQVCYSLYYHNSQNISDMIAQTQAGKNVARLGYQDDIHFCSKKNLYQIVPRYANGSIKGATTGTHL